jgi:hypothetical protein
MREVYASWQKDPEGFWAEAAKAIDWVRPWDRVFARVDGLDRWFVGASATPAGTASTAMWRPAGPTSRR